jgi:hypothetical protein
LLEYLESEEASFFHAIMETFGGSSGDRDSKLNINRLMDNGSNKPDNWCKLLKPFKK